MNKIGAREFALGWRSLTEPVEVYNRDKLIGTWMPAPVEGGVNWDPEALDELKASRQQAIRADRARSELLNRMNSAKTAKKGRK